MKSKENGSQLNQYSNNDQSANNE